MVRVFDFFSGCGGTSLGFQNGGFEIAGALDFDHDSIKTFRSNFPEAFTIQEDIRTVRPADLSGILNKRRRTPLLFSGCAPCQPFSKHQRRITSYDSRRSLLTEFSRFITYWKPEYLFLENVPGLQNIDKNGGMFKTFLQTLKHNKYEFDMQVVDASRYGVPQTRKRFILIACRQNSGLSISPIEYSMTFNNVEPATTKMFISDLPEIKAGESHPDIPNHESAKLSAINLNRIKNTPPGGDRRNWPAELTIPSHKNHKGHTDVYGRMAWNAPAPTLTTRCISYSNGRFGHPEQHRAISVREAARLQTFPDEFVFHGSLSSCARQVGNAVAPEMAKYITRCFN